MTAPIRAVLFDLDGTLLDTAPDLVRALNEVRREQGREPLPFTLARTQVSHGSSGLIRLGFPDLSGDPLEALRLRLLEIYSLHLAVGTRLFDGCQQVLDYLAARAMPWGIVTNKPAFLTQPLLATLNLERLASCVVSGDTLPQRKPHPAPLQLAASQLKMAPAHCLYVGDAERDVQSARAAGMPVLVAHYGYLGPADDPEAWAPDGHIDSPLQILDYLQGGSAS
ncbi:MAG TPA: HAD-IA family hydrolase [Steroidobacteraceae bacterium]|nr:HAD-IA family hydrolase [Steroidobacteraceae bacterium]